MKFSYIYIMFFLSLINCSFDKNSKLWDYKDKDKSANESIELTDKIEYEKYKQKILIYSKKTDYPDIN